MAYLVPNATSTTSGNRYVAFDQAEPDSLDIEVLGSEQNGVLEGCAVTSNGSNSGVTVAAGVVLIGGVPHDLPGGTVGLPPAPADNRFDLIVARKTGSTATLAVVRGANSSGNPAYPPSINVLDAGTTYDSALHFNLETETILAATFRTGSSVVTDAHIVDKRRMINLGTIILRGSDVPDSGDGVVGSFYRRTTAPVGTASGLYYKTDAGWVALKRDNGPDWPIGFGGLWTVPGPLHQDFLYADGQLESTTEYPDLFALYGYFYGGSGNQFGMPNYNDYYLMGTTSNALMASHTGSNTKTLTDANLPRHRHQLAGTLSIAHNHGDITVSPQFATGTIQANTIGTITTETANAKSGWPHFKSILQSDVYLGTMKHFWGVAKAGGWPTSGQAGILYGNIEGVSRIHPDNSLWDAHTYTASNDGTEHKHPITINGGSHGHIFNANAHAHVVILGTQSPSVVSLAGKYTEYVGETSPTAVNVQPATAYTRYAIRARVS